MTAAIKKIGAAFTFSLFFTVMSVLIYMDMVPLLAFPIGLIAIYFALFHAEYLLISLFFFTPVSVNIEEWTDGFGLFIPTEPLLFGLMILLVWRSMLTKTFPAYLLKNLIVISLISYLSVVLLTSLVSVRPIVSFKFLLAKLWFIIPIIGFGTKVFENKKNIKIALWLFSVGIIITVIYTVTHHAMYRFGEKESHWVMSPIFKDHTIYGALVAFTLPILIALYFYRKHSLLLSMVILLLIGINLTGLYFSYTRAAWLSIFAALVVWGLIHFRIRFSYLLTIALIGIGIVLFNWDDISYAMSKNKKEHTTEDFGERLQSATNVTTDASNLERINRWSCAIQMFEERPWTGFGPGTYAFEYAPFQRPENLTIISTNFGDGGNAHSEYLSALSETGIFGLLTFVFFVSMIFYKGITLYYRLEEKDSKIIVLALILSLTTYFVHAFLNNYLDTDKAAVPIFGACAMFIALEHTEVRKKK